MRPRSFAVALGVGAILLAAFAAGAGPKPPPATVKPYSQEEYLGLAVRVFDDGFDDAKRRDAVRDLLAGRDRTATGARQLSSRGALLIAFGRPEGVLCAAQAAIDAPGDPLVATTFGAALSRIKKKDEALRVQLYALGLGPRLAPVLTNLGSIYAQLGDGGLAKERLGEATAVDRGFCPAWNALATLHANEGNHGEGVAAFLRSLPCTTLRRAREKYAAERPPPPEPEGGPATGAARLELRPFPVWPTVDDFLADTVALGAWNDGLTALFEKTKADFDNQAKAEAGRKRHSSPAEPAAVMRIGLDLLERQYAGALDSLRERHRETVAATDAKLAAGVAAELQRFDAVPVIPQDAKREAKSRYCKAVPELQGPAFAAWRDDESGHYADATALLRRYFEEASRLLGYFQDDAERRSLEAVVEARIWSKLAAFPAGYPQRAAAYARQRTTPAGECAAADERPAAPAAVPPEDRRPAMVPAECPIPRDGKLAVEAELAGIRCGIALEGCAAFRAACAEVAHPPGLREVARYEMEKKDLALSLGVYAPGKSARFTEVVGVALRDGQLERVSWGTGPAAKAPKGFEGKLTIPLLDPVGER